MSDWVGDSKVKRWSPFVILLAAGVIAFLLKGNSHSDANLFLLGLICGLALGTTGCLAFLKIRQEML